MVKLATMQTGVLGGIEPPGADQLLRMQRADYVLRARDGQIIEVPAEKSRLPPDPDSHPQAVRLFKGAGTAIYARQPGTLSRSDDGGRTWTSRPVPAAPRETAALQDGALVGVDAGADRPAEVFHSEDEGASWRKTTEFELPVGFEDVGVTGVTRLRDGALICDIHVGNGRYENDWGPRLIAGTVELLGFRSDDGGQTWEGPYLIMRFAGEGGFAHCPSGRLLAVKRYQRGLLPDESDRMMNQMGVNQLFVRWGLAAYRLFKNIALVESLDGGRTWTDERLLTTVFGQCYGYPVVLEEGTVVVVHDTRYGPGPQSSRAMISRDEGCSWEDETYYLCHGSQASGYTQSVVLDDGTILTLGGTSDRADGDTGSWNKWVGHADLTAIRWRLED